MTKEEKIKAIEESIVDLFEEYKKASKTEHIRQYKINDGKTDITTSYNSAIEVIGAITASEKLLVEYKKQV